MFETVGSKTTSNNVVFLMIQSIYSWKDIESFITIFITSYLRQKKEIAKRNSGRRATCEWEEDSSLISFESEENPVAAPL